MASHLKHGRFILAGIQHRIRVPKLPNNLLRLVTSPSSCRQPCPISLSRVVIDIAGRSMTHWQIRFVRPVIASEACNYRIGNTRR